GGRHGRRDRQGGSRSLRLGNTVENNDPGRTAPQGTGVSRGGVTAMNQARVFTHPAFARQRFREVAARQEPIDLVEASLIIDLEDRPGLDLDRYLAQVRAWTDAVRERLEGSHDVERIVDSINGLLFDEEGFHGEDEDYYDPRSALLSETLDRHAGLPITLSILYIEISRRMGMHAAG